MSYHRRASYVALVSMTVTVAAYSDVRCPKCHRLVMTVPGRVMIEVRTPRDNADRSGRGAVVSCKRCGGLVEAIVLREAS